MSHERESNIGDSGNYILHLSLTHSISETKSRFISAQDVDKAAIKEEGWEIPKEKPELQGITKHKATGFGAPPELRRALQDIAVVRSNLRIKVREYAMCRSALIAKETF